VKGCGAFHGCGSADGPAVEVPAHAYGKEEVAPQPVLEGSDHERLGLRVPVCKEDPPQRREDGRIPVGEKQVRQTEAYAAQGYHGEPVLEDASVAVEEKGPENELLGVYHEEGIDEDEYEPEPGLGRQEVEKIHPLEQIGEKGYSGCCDEEGDHDRFDVDREIPDVPEPLPVEVLVRDQAQKAQERNEQDDGGYPPGEPVPDEVERYRKDEKEDGALCTEESPFRKVSELKPHTISSYLKSRRSKGGRERFLSRNPGPASSSVKA